jgi:hypothetical protein
MTEADGTRPEHDPLAEDLDLLTSKEGVARLYDELVATRELAASLDGASDPGGLGEARARIRNLEEAIERARKRVTPTW